MRIFIYIIIILFCIFNSLAGGYELLTLMGVEYQHGGIYDGLVKPLLFIFIVTSIFIGIWLIKKLIKKEY